MSDLFKIEGKIAIVTGGASGIGAMITEGLVRSGCKVLIASRKEEALSEFTRSMNEIVPNSVEYCVANLMTEDGMDALSEAAKNFSDHIDILINNSGATWMAKLDDFPVSAWDKILGLNVTAVAEVTRRMLPLLEKNAGPGRPARVINIGSVMGTKASEYSENSTGAYSYSVSKAAVHHLTKSFSNELAPRHISVNAIAPGPFVSRMMAFATDTEEKRKALAEPVPLGRIGAPDDVAGTVQWLCSRAGAYVSGAIIPLDGGMAASA